jgi:elongator complex protein 1
LQSALCDKLALVDSVIHPSLLSTQAFILEDVAEVEEQMEKQLSRLAELAILKTEQPDAFFMQDDPALENIDVMTDATGASEFTRYTNNASTVLTRFTGMTKYVFLAALVVSLPSIDRLLSRPPRDLLRTTNQSSKMKRKNARKAASGRKGTVDEELYLLGSFARLVDKFKTLIGASCIAILTSRMRAFR